MTDSNMRTWIKIYDVGKALDAGKLWLLSGPEPRDRHIAIADTEEEARKQFPRVTKKWTCERANLESSRD